MGLRFRRTFSCQWDFVEKNATTGEPYQETTWGIVVKSTQDGDDFYDVQCAIPKNTVCYPRLSTLAFVVLSWPSPHLSAFSPVSHGHVRDLHVLSNTQMGTANVSLMFRGKETVAIPYRGAKGDNTVKVVSSW